ncbi:hypothetical protein BC834DRAFT_592999 [Gloeopeniophorella convolvens]|nr:hypothetical protein BC834DRAFT_592999 [Gloeopeniophorella convolvens]
MKIWAEQLDTTKEEPPCNRASNQAEQKPTKIKAEHTSLISDGTTPATAWGGVLRGARCRESLGESRYQRDVAACLRTGMAHPLARSHGWRWVGLARPTKEITDPSGGYIYPPPGYLRDADRMQRALHAHPRVRSYRWQISRRRPNKGLD